MAKNISDFEKFETRLKRAKQELVSLFQEFEDWRQAYMRGELPKTIKETIASEEFQRVIIGMTAHVDSINICGSEMKVNIHFENGEVEQSLDSKKQTSSWLNRMARTAGAGYMAPNDPTETPHIFVVSKSRDGKGRYTYENKRTKKRTGSYKSINDMLPLVMVYDPTILLGNEG